MFLIDRERGEVDLVVDGGEQTQTRLQFSLVELEKSSFIGKALVVGENSFVEHHQRAEEVADLLHFSHQQEAVFNHLDVQDHLSNLPECKGILKDGEDYEEEKNEVADPVESQDRGMHQLVIKRHGERLPGFDCVFKCVILLFILF